MGRFRARAATTAPPGLVFPALGLLLFGLLTHLSSREDLYANPEYGFSVLALFGAARYIGHLSASIPRSGVVRVVPAAAAVVPGVVPYERS